MRMRSGPVTRLEFGLLLVFLLLGFVLRDYKLSSAGLDHFDEGVYVFSALGLSDAAQPLRLYPGQIKFSPPVYFGLVALSYLISGGPSDTTAIFLNVVLGTLSILVLWWAGRSWFGPRAGIAAAALLTFNEYHIALSRSALTDVSFVLFFLLALMATAAALNRQSLGFSVLAGLAVGVAWNTKYHGWFAVIIAAAAILLSTLFGARRGHSLGRLILLWGIMVSVAALCYLPWGLFIQSHPGGYPALLKYEHTLFSLRWFHNLEWQALMQFFLEGPFTRAGVLVAFWAALFVGGQPKLKARKGLFTVLFLSGLALTVGGEVTAAILTLLAIPALLRNRRSFPTWLMLSWLAVWGISTPFYHPYARLVMPFTIATFIVGGFWISTVIGKEQSPEAPFPWFPLAAFGAAIIVAGIASVLPDASNPWRPSRSVAEAAAEMHAIIPEGSRTIVLGEPELAFYLHLSGRPAFERIEDMAVLAGLSEPVYVITGRYSAMRVIREGLDKLKDRLHYLGTFPMDPKDLRLLDDYPPLSAWRVRAHPDDTYNLKVYRLLPKG